MLLSLLVQVLSGLTLWAAAVPISQLPTLEINAQIEPSQHLLRGTVVYHFKQFQPTMTFNLHKNMRVSIARSTGATIIREREENHGMTRLIPHVVSGMISHYKLRMPPNTRDFLLSFDGNPEVPLDQDSFSTGTLNKDGVQLLSDSHWYPAFEGLFKFKITVTTPTGWHAITSGGQHSVVGGKDVYEGILPGGDLALIANQFTVYSTNIKGGPEVRVLLTKDDPALAQNYLTLIPEYIERYSKIIGPFPFKSFTVAENTFETGFAFQGLTLLGPSVMRIPGILKSSLPHEILHSWWGESVLVDYSRGNWCEGLTTYMADQAFQAEEGKGTTYRRNALQAFSDFALQGQDFPVRKFVSRNDRGTQAVGYAKSMMIFQMLENLVGKNAFYEALRDFFQSQTYQQVSFEELQASFEKVTGRNLDSFFTPWLNQVGAPIIKIQKELQTERQLTFSISQEGMRQPAVIPFNAQLRFENGRTSDLNIVLDQQSQRYSLRLENGLKGLSLDPKFKVFRQLYSEEAPLTFSKLFGERSLVTVSVPFGEEQAFAPWVSGIRSIYAENTGLRVQVVSDGQDLPQTTGALWILGNNNRHALKLNPIWEKRGLTTNNSGQLDFAGKKSWSPLNGTVFITDNWGNTPVVWTWTSVEQPGNVLMAKIAHYTSLSIVGFTNAKNDFTDTWAVGVSPLAISLSN